MAIFELTVSRYRRHRGRMVVLKRDKENHSVSVLCERVIAAVIKDTLTSAVVGDRAAGMGCVQRGASR